MSIVEQLREVQTLEGGRKPYAKADISIREVDPNDCFPTSKYVLVCRLVEVGQIARALKLMGIDITKLDDIIPYDGTVIAPPVIENDGQADCIVDGLHRMTIARARHEVVKVLYVANPETPPIGKPVSWELVKIVKEPPETAQERRDLREGLVDTSECLRSHFRDLAFLGSNGRRPRKGQTG